MSANEWQFSGWWKEENSEVRKYYGQAYWKEKMQWFDVDKDLKVLQKDHHLGTLKIKDSKDKSYKFYIGNIEMFGEKLSMLMAKYKSEYNDKGELRDKNGYVKLKVDDGPPKKNP